MLLAAVLVAGAQTGGYGKMSPLVRQAAMGVGRHVPAADGRSTRHTGGGSICAFVKVDGDAGTVLQRAGCRRLAQLGSISIADIPLNAILPLSQMKEVVRIEAGRSCSLAMDTSAVIVDAVRVHSGAELPQAYTGNGVVMGLMDVGFDLTHPNFYDSSLAATRIRRFWDQLSADSIGSALYVGADYRTPEAILAYGRSHDGLIETHGTHTLGIAAGTGHTTAYRGIAPDADICLVSNAVNTDIPLIPEEQLFKYTTATDALGFKYIFDYASEVGKPCVISFSECSTETLDGEQQLFYEALQALTGPGRILVASAGNNGYSNTYLHKPQGRESDGALLHTAGEGISLSAVADKPFSLRIAAYAGGETVRHSVHTDCVLASVDSVLCDSLFAHGCKLVYRIKAYRSALEGSPLAYDIAMGITADGDAEMEKSLELVGADADVQLFCNGATFLSGDSSLSLGGGEKKCCIGSPASAPAVVCVGATAYRDSYVGLDGSTHGASWGSEGEVARFSSVGPTRYGLCKPDVVAPGAYIVSSMSNFFVEATSTDGYKDDLCTYTTFQGRRYPWGVLSGTSQSSPIVGGAIALWLEADPRLTTADILDIFAATCCRQHTQTQGAKDNRSGYGEIDVYAGLLRVLRLDGIEGLSHSQPSSARIMYKGGGDVEIRIARAAGQPSPARVSVYSSGGAKVAEFRPVFTDGAAAFSLHSLPPGVYAVQLSTGSPSSSGSVLIRI